MSFAESLTELTNYTNLLTNDEVVFLYEVGDYINCMPDRFRVSFELNIDQPVYIRYIDLPIGRLSWTTDKDFYIPGLSKFVERFLVPDIMQQIFISYTSERQYTFSKLVLTDNNNEWRNRLVGYATLNINSPHDLLAFLNEDRTSE